MSTYQSVLDKLELVEQDLELHEIQLENEEVELLRTFLSWYIGELEKELGEEQQQGLDILKTINHLYAANKTNFLLYSSYMHE